MSNVNAVAPVRTGPKIVTRGSPLITIPDEDVEQFAADLGKGVPLRYASGGVGITEQTMGRWLILGNQARQLQEAGADINERDAFLIRLWWASEKALRSFIVGRLENLHRHELKQWTASAWMLERSFPHLFGQRGHLAVAHEFRVSAGEGRQEPMEVMTDGQGAGSS